MPAKRGMAYADLVKFAETLEGVEQSTSYGTPALKVRGKLFVRLWEDGETVVLKSEWEAREQLLATHPDVFFLTDHYRNHPYVLLRLPVASKALMQTAVEASWRTVAPGLKQKGKLQSEPVRSETTRKRVRAFVDKAHLRDLVNRFANCFDLKDWTGLQNCLSKSVHTDYSELRGTPPETISSSRFVKLRRTALEPLATQHLMSNHEIEVDGDTAKAIVSCVIFRKNPGNERLNTHCIYFFGMQREGDAWKISAIRQKVLLNDGDTGIHAGIVRK